MTCSFPPESSENPKSRAWDALGLKWWYLGRRGAKPSAGTVRWFTRELVSGDRCLVVGGTSIGLIRAAARTGCAVDVFDFSARICAEARRHLPAAVRITHRDVLEPAPAWEGSFTHLVCDALINRFDADEARRFEVRAAGLLAPGGRLRAVVKIGLYAMDLRLLDVASRSGATDFWDDETRTIDYERVGSLLEDGLVRHGGISRGDLLGWYRSRGREKRYSEDDLRLLFTTPRWSSLRLGPDGRATDRARMAATRATAR